MYKNMQIKIRWKFLLVIIVVIILLVINTGPLLWGFLTSLKRSNEILSLPPRPFGSIVTLEHYQRIFEGGFMVPIRNSLIYSGLAVLIGLLFGSLAAYGFDRFRFFGDRVWFFVVITGIPISISSSSILVPTYLYLTKLGLTNKWFTLILLYTVYNLPMGIWILKGSFATIPREISEAAVLDGCSDLFVLWKIILPLAKPGLVAAAMFIFVGAWNEFLASSVMVDSPAFKSMQVAIYDYMGFYGREWGPLLASGVVGIIPVMTLFSVLGKFLVRGLAGEASLK